jgi:ABC-type glycerol-3-phosphate transport system substrate-binding protein
MKKIFKALALLLVLMVGLTLFSGCAGDTSSETENGAVEQEETTGEVEESTEQEDALEEDGAVEEEEASN